MKKIHFIFSLIIEQHVFDKHLSNKYLHYLSNELTLINHQ